MRQRDPATVGTRPAIAPLHQREDGWKQLLTLDGEVVVLPATLPGNVIRAPLHQALGDEFLEPGGRDLLAELGAVWTTMFRTYLRLLNVLTG